MSGWRALSCWISGAALLVGVQIVSAAEKRAEPAETPTAEAEPCTGDTAILLLACQLASQLPKAPRVLLSHGDASGSGQLNAVSAKLQHALAEALRGKARRLSQSSVYWPRAGKPTGVQVVEYSGLQTKGEAAKRTHEGQQIYLELRLSLGTLNVKASVFSAELRGFWDRVRNPARSLKVFAASAPGDPSVRTLLARSTPAPQPPKLAASFAFTTEPALALACEYNQKRDGLRIAFVGRGSVWVDELTRGKLETKKRWPWAKLSEVAPVPLREPLASIALAPDGSVEAGLSDRRFMLRLSLLDDSLARWEGRLPWPSVGCLERSGLGLDSLSGCPTGNRASTPLFVVGGVVDAVAGANLLSVKGRRKTFGAVRKLGSVEALVFGAQDAPLQISGVGSSLALGDIDGDGAPEFLNSLPTFSVKEDAFEVRWLDSSGAARLRTPVPDGIVAMAVCPWLGGTYSPVVVASKSSLLVFQ